MSNVQVFHVGSPNPAIIDGADFRTEGEGDLIVYRDKEVVAQFATGKWSAAIKMLNQPMATAHTYTVGCAGHHGIDEKCP